MLSDIRQEELDLAERKLLLALFGSETPGPKAQWLMNFLGIDINSWIREFEYLVRPMLDSQGRVQAELARALVAEKWPAVNGLLPRENFRLVELAEPLAKLITSVKGKLR